MGRHRAWTVRHLTLGPASRVRPDEANCFNFNSQLQLQINSNQLNDHNLKLKLGVEVEFVVIAVWVARRDAWVLHDVCAYFMMALTPPLNEYASYPAFCIFSARYAVWIPCAQ
jgi:hypothetical protein